MERHEIVKDKNGKFVRYEHWENGKRKEKLERSKGELPAKADWNEIEKERKTKKQRKK